MFRYRRHMRKFFGVFGDLFLFNSRFDAGKHFYDNAVTRQLTFTGLGKVTKRCATFSELSEFLFAKSSGSLYRREVCRRAAISYLFNGGNDLPLHVSLRDFPAG